MSANAVDLAIKANKRALSLLDKMIAETSEVDGDLAVDALLGDQSLPFSYVTLDGVDGLPGVNLTVADRAAGNTLLGPTQPYYGFVRVQSDAAFVATRVFAVARMVTDVVAAPVYWDAPSAESCYGFQLRLRDESNAREINLSYNAQQIPQQAVALPLSLFGQSHFSAQGGLELPAECVFPRNATIRVEAMFTSGLDDAPTAAPQVSACRVGLIWHGYKVFGG